MAVLHLKPAAGLFDLNDALMLSLWQAGVISRPAMLATRCKPPKRAACICCLVMSCLTHEPCLWQCCAVNATLYDLYEESCSELHSSRPDCSSAHVLKQEHPCPTCPRQGSCASGARLTPGASRPSELLASAVERGAAGSLPLPVAALCSACCSANCVTEGC